MPARAGQQEPLPNFIGPTHCIQWGRRGLCRLHRSSTQADGRRMCTQPVRCVPSLMRRMLPIIRNNRVLRRLLHMIQFLRNAIPAGVPHGPLPGVDASSPIPPEYDAFITTRYQDVVRGRGRSPASMLAVTIGNGVVLGPSTLGPTVGHGLFASRPFRRNDWVTGLDGLVCSGYDSHRRLIRQGALQTSHTSTLIRNHMWLDGLKIRNPPPGVGGGSYANDASFDPVSQQLTRTPNNTVFRFVNDPVLPNVPVLFLRAVVDIPIGTEITVGYGRDYWVRYLNDQSASSSS